MRVVLDTNQIVAAGTRWLDNLPPDPVGNLSRRLIIRIATDHTGLYCGEIAGEYMEKLLNGPHLVARAKEMMVLILGAFDRVTVVTRQAPTVPVDRDDEIFLLCAIDGQSDYIVTDDSHLLELREAYGQFVIGKPSEIAPALGA